MNLDSQSAPVVLVPALIHIAFSGNSKNGTR
jgi:hypothetical protein